MLTILPSFGGSVLAMIITLKNNARKRRKPFELQKDRDNLKFKSHHALHYKKASDEKLKEVKSKIRKSIEKEDTKKLLIITLVIVIICSFALWEAFYAQTM